MEKITYNASFFILIIMIYLDFFKPNISLTIPTFLFLLTLILTLIFSRIPKFSWEISEKKEIILNISRSSLLLILINIFYLLGGRSQHDLNPTNYIMWIIYFFTLLSLYKRFLKNTKNEKNESIYS